MHLLCFWNRRPRRKSRCWTNCRASYRIRRKRYLKCRIHGYGRTSGKFQCRHPRHTNSECALGTRIGARKITVSTVGLPVAIEKLAAFDVPVTLALSLHAPNDEVRQQLIPWARFSPIKDLLEACSTYFDATGREITLEYLLLGGVNDRTADAKELVGLCKTLRCNVNLIRYNEVPELDYTRPKTEQVRRFQEILMKAGVNTHIRASRGRDISAACGQLKREHVQINLG